MPRRLQLSRRAGFDLQVASIALNGLPAVNVARPGPFGNPFAIGDRYQVTPATGCLALRHASVTGGPIVTVDQALAVALYRDFLHRYPRADLAELAGKNLACWCKADEPCHADVLLEAANG